MRTTSFFILIVALLLLAGCGGDPSRPADLPKLYPVSITITQEGNPVEGATVTLVSKTPTKYGTSAGSTDSSGIAGFRTYGFDGVPEGEYAVMVDKMVEEGAREITTSTGDTHMTRGKTYRYVEPKYLREAQTPLGISVTTQGAKETFDVGAPVRIFVSTD